MSAPEARVPSITAGALIGLLVGLAAGIGVHATRDPAWIGAAASVGVIGTLWSNALRMLVIPLVVVNLVTGIATTSDARAVGRLGAISLVVFVLMLAAGSGFGFLFTVPVLATWAPGAATLGASRALADSAAASAGHPLSFSDWLTALVPTNPIRAAADDQILPLLVFTVLFGLALTRIAPDSKRALLEVFRALREAIFVLLGWVLRCSPIGVFALAFAFAARIGSDSIGTLGFWIVLVCGVTLAFTLLLYPVTALLGRVSLVRFARAALPAQAVGIGTRSSLAALPALIEGAERTLEIPTAVAGFVLPLAVSTFKVNRAVDGITKLLFLAALYHLSLDPMRVATFVLMVGIISFSTPGIPSAGTISSLPAYLACGIPIQGVLLLNAVEAIPDIFKTLLNVTGDLSAVAIVHRFAGLGRTATAAANRVEAETARALGSSPDAGLTRGR
jgi:Na+/H+-dicarboxylate symporter